MASITISLLQLNLNGSGGRTLPPTSAFFGGDIKKLVFKPKTKASSGKFKVVAAEVDEDKQTNKDRWRGLAFDESDDQQDITRGKGMVDTLFQAPMDSGTHYAVLSSYEYLSTGLRQ